LEEIQERQDRLERDMEELKEEVKIINDLKGQIGLLVSNMATTLENRNRKIEGFREESTDSGREWKGKRLTE